MLKRTLIVLILSLVLTSCGQATAISAAEPTQPQGTPATATSTLTTSTPAPLPTATPTQIPIHAGTPVQGMLRSNDSPVNVNPLTGLPVADPSLLERRPIAIKINIWPRSWYRPAWGLSLADIVYDYYHNAGYARFHAIFYGNDAEYAGPVRSGRLLDHDLILMYKSIFAYGGADPRVNVRLLNSEYSERLVLEGERTACPPTAEKPLCRHEASSSGLMLSSTQALSEHITALGIENGRQDLAGMAFDSRTPDGGVAGSQVYVRYSVDNYLRWDYDPSTGRYLRFQDDALDAGGGEVYAPLIERMDGEQIAADNVVILMAHHEYYQRPPNEIVEIWLSGSGDGYIYRDGRMYPVVWNRPTIKSVLSLTYPDGTEFPFKPGTTWFQVIGTSSTVTQPGEGIHRFVFGFP